MCKLLTSRPTPTQRDTGLRKNWAFLLVALALTFLLPAHHVLAPLAPGNQPVALDPAGAEVRAAGLPECLGAL